MLSGTKKTDKRWTAIGQRSAAAAESLEFPILGSKLQNDVIMKINDTATRRSSRI